MDNLKLGECKNAILPIVDTLEVLQGKWKLLILLSLTFGNHGFRELERQIPKISPRMLSKELKLLEENQLVNRKVMNTKPITVEYSLTTHGMTLKPVLFALRDWGVSHRKKIFSV